MEKIKKNSLWIILLIAFSGWSYLVVQGNFKVFDYQVFTFIHKYWLNDFSSFFFKVITYLGNVSTLAFIIIVSFIVFKNKYISIGMGINLFLVSMLNLLLKSMFMIPRPDIQTLIEESGYSYPSGHAMLSLAFYGFIIYLGIKRRDSSLKKLGIIIFFSLLILLIGFSRIYLGVHHFSDIIGGYLISLTYLLLYIRLYKVMGMEDVYEVQKGNKKSSE